jgi:hypothetical protein
MKYLQQFVTTSLNVGGGIDASQTTGIVLQSLNNIDATKPSVACISWADPLSTSIAEWVTYTSINSTTNELNGVTRGAEGYSAKTHSNGATVAFPLSKAHVNEVNDSVDTGWVIVNETFTYASATTITVATGAASRFQKGDKLKLTNNTVKYFYIVGVASTLLTVTGGSDYALADAAITSPYLSRVGRPFGFPGYFSHTMVLDGWSGTPTQASKFSISTGGTVTFSVYITGTSDETTGAGTNFTLPVTPVNNMYYPVRVTDNGTVAATPGMVAIAASTGLGTCYSTMAAGGWTGSGTKAIGAATFSYFI